MKMLLQVVVFFLLTRAAVVWSSCVNSWAVQIHGGREMAERVALKHGFELREKVIFAAQFFGEHADVTQKIRPLLFLSNMFFMHSIGWKLEEYLPFWHG